MTRPSDGAVAKKEPWLCWLGLHSFGLWGQKFSIPGSAYAFEFQQRTCVKCGYVDERRIKGSS